MSGRQGKEPEPEQAQGAPEWMVTFSDCMTLLLTFFVLLLSLSSFDERVFRTLRTIYSEALPRITPIPLRNQDAFLWRLIIQNKDEPELGSEKPTLQRKPVEGLMRETRPIELPQSVVFRIPSEHVFLGRGKMLSRQGQQALGTLAQLLKRIPGEIILAEGSPENTGSEQSLAVERAWAVMQYLSAVKGIEKERFSISAGGVGLGCGVPGCGRAGQTGSSRRMVEVVFLQKGLCR